MTIKFFSTSEKTPQITLSLTPLLVMGMTFSGAVLAQTAGPESFDATESALTGTVACNGAQPSPIISVDASTTDVSGSNDALSSSLSGNACSLPLYSIASANDASDASDTTNADDGGGTSVISNECLLGGVVCFGSKKKTDTCTSNSTGAVSCQETSYGTNLYFGGQHITGTFTAPTTFHATNLQLNLGGACTGIAVFNGDLILASSSETTVNGITNATIAPITLNGTMTCLGLPLTTMTVALQDWSSNTWQGDYILVRNSGTTTSNAAIKPQLLPLIDVIDSW